MSERTTDDDRWLAYLCGLILLFGAIGFWLHWQEQQDQPKPATYDSYWAEMDCAIRIAPDGNMNISGCSFEGDDSKWIENYAKRVAARKKEMRER